MGHQRGPILIREFGLDGLREPTGDFVMAAIERTGYRPGTDIGLVMDPASSDLTTGCVICSSGSTTVTRRKTSAEPRPREEVGCFVRGLSAWATRVTWCGTTTVE